MLTATENTAKWASEAAPPAVPFQGQDSTQSQDFWNSCPHVRLPYIKATPKPV